MLIDQFHFNFNQLPEHILRELLKWIPLLSQFRVIQVCREWRQLFLPLVWEYILPEISYNKWSVIKKVFMKNAHHIKIFNINQYVKVPLNMELYRNVKEMIIPWDYYFEKRLFNYDIKVSGLICTKKINSLDFKDYFELNEIDLKPLVKDLKYLNVFRLTTYFLTTILPLLPSNIKALYIGIVNEIELTDTILDFLPNLSYIEVCIYGIKDQDGIFQGRLFNNLTTLKIHRNYSNCEIIIDSSYFPQLTYLSCSSYPVFKGRLKLREVYLSLCYEKKNQFNKETFPCLRILSMIDICFSDFETIYNIFKLTSVTRLILEFSSKQQIFGIPEIYPKQSSNLLYLRIQNCIIGDYFFNFILNSCKILETLILLNHTYFSDKLWKHIPISCTNLTSIMISEHNPKLDKIMMSIFKSSPKLNIFSIYEVPDDHYLCIFKNIKNLNLSKFHRKHIDYF